MSRSDPMRALVDAFPEMLEEAAGAPMPEQFVLDQGRVWLLGGMGGSGMAAILGGHLLEESGSPATAWNHVPLPRWVSPEDRAVVVSYSGMTWEAVAMVEEALSRAIPLRAVSSGGRIVSICQEQGVPCFPVPAGMPPRASLPWLVVGACRATGSLTDESIAGAVDLLREERRAPSPERDPLRLAERIKGRLAIFLPIGATMERVALRWRNQILENAEQACFVSPAPEMAHNETMGWPWLRDVDIPVSFFVLVDRPDVTTTWQPLLSALEEEAQRGGHPFEVIPPIAAAGFESLMAEIYLADRVSVELADLCGVAATPVPAIGRLRAAMERKRT